MNRRQQNTPDISNKSSRQEGVESKKENDQYDIDRENLSSQENEEVFKDKDFEASNHLSQNLTAPKQQHPPATTSDDGSDESTNTPT